MVNRLLVLFITGAVLAGGVISVVPDTGQTQSVERPETAQAPQPAGNTTTKFPQTNDRTDTYRITVTSEAALNRSMLQKHGEVGTQAGSAIELTTTRTGANSVAEFSWVEDVRPSVEKKPSNIAGGGTASSLGVESLHERGITGENVSVGLVLLGIDSSVSGLDGDIASLQRFSAGYEQDHGTKVAKTVLKTAPDAQLHVAISTTGVDDEAAYRYLRQKDVDIIVMSSGFPYADDDGDHFFTDDIRAAYDSGSLPVISAGNYALAHWEGDFSDSDGDDLHEFVPGDERNCIASCQRTYRGQLDITLHWSQDGDGSEYRVLLYDSVSDQYVATSQDLYNGGETLTRSGDSRPLDIVIQHTDGPADDELELTVTTSGPQQIERYVPESSISPPADVSSAVAVGAYSRYREQITDYSSRGPTDDGRQGLTVAGYTNIELDGPRYGGVFGGTSAAAPHVGGVAALIEDATSEDLTADELQDRLTGTADDIGSPGPDPVSGAGVVNATAVIPSRSGADSTRPSIVADQDALSASTGETVTVTYTVTNPAGSSTSLLVELPNLPGTLSLQTVDGEIAQDLSQSDPPSVITESVPAGGETTIDATFEVAENATPGEYTIQAKAVLQAESEVQNTTARTNLSVTEQQTLVSRFGGDDGKVDNLDVLRAVNAANSGNEIGGKPVNNLDILRLVNHITG